MPRLLILCEYPTVLGGERSMLATLPAIAGAGFQVVIAAPGEGHLAGTLRERGIEHIPWRTCDSAGSRLPLEELRSNLENIIRNVHPDILHANSLSTARIAGPVAALCSVKSIGHLRDIIKLTSQAIDDLNSHCKLIAVSRATRDFHVAQGLDATKCVVLHNGIDLREFHPRPASGYLHRELNIPRTSPLIATVGQLGLRKGTDVALAAALPIAEQCPDAHWMIVGERTSNKLESREFEMNLRWLAADAAIAARVHFLGSRRDIAVLLPECHTLVHTARQEPLGRVLIEAAACGLA
ncbi:MAG TPA: glycosyltransferase family 4 protein, partial [Lacipirellulaceae bacterium]|nr:glycosyltransferase family 4 protein [Lacipirellulaceae bacterium]